MSLAYILKRVASEAGTSDLGSNPEVKAWLLDHINQAAQEIYRRKDLPVSLREVFIRAQSCKRLVLPPFVGELRAIRSGCCSDCARYNLSELRPKYNNRPWDNLWNQWEEKWDSPIEVEEFNIAPGSVSYPVADSELQITLVGETKTSNRTIETIAMSSADMDWTNSFFQFNAIRKNKITDHNVILYDADGEELSIIYADQLEARFRVVDVSKYPFPGGCACADGTYPMELLYKPKLARLELDQDTFPVEGYDDAIVLKTRQLIAELQPGKEDRAVLMDQRVARNLKEIEQDKADHINKRIKYAANPLLGIFAREYPRSRNWPYNS